MFEPDRNSRIAWGVAHLFHGGPEHQDSLTRRLLEQLASGTDPMIAIEHWYEANKVEDLEKVFAGYLASARLAYLLQPEAIWPR